MEQNIAADNKKKLTILVALFLLIALPLLLIVVKQTQIRRSGAALADKLEAEIGVLSSTGVSKQTDSQASGGQYVVFANQNPTPTPQTGLKYPPDTQLTSSTPTSFARPGYLISVTEPNFGTKITRVTDPSGFGGSTIIRHHYSKDSAWNRDGSRILMGRYLLDGKTYQVIKTLPVSGEYRWSNTDPNKIFMTDSSNNFKTLNVSTGAIATIRNFPGYELIRLGPNEGNLSNDDGFVVVSGKNGTNYTAIVFNIKANIIISTKTFPGKWDAGIDWASISSSGKYVVINTGYCNPGCYGTIEVYDRNMNHVIQASNKAGHGDLTTDLDGNDYFVYVLGQTGDYVTKTRLDTGTKTVLLTAISSGGHISCRNLLRPGWCYGTFSSSSYKEAIGFKLDGSGTVNRFAHHRSTQSIYDTQAKGVVSMDGTKMLWTSDWGFTEGSFFDYVAEMP